MANGDEKARQIMESEKFKELVRKKTAITIIMTILMLIVYFGFILIIAFDKSLLATKIGDHVTIGLPIGIGVIIFAWILTGIYIRWANNSYDKIVNEIKTDLYQNKII